ncbi:MAG: hypothetical protein R3192_06440 [Woeseiaceae bacterium]|nr:hypothetical protein [Woeseiaceae bacterium]
MKTVNWKTAVELAGITGILIGLYFVYAELRLNSTIARAELNIGVFQLHENLQNHFHDSDFVSVYLKGIEVPEQLSIAERRRLGAFFDAIQSIFVYEFHNYHLGLFPEFEELPRVLVRRHMTGKFGRAWWDLRKQNVPDDLRIVIDDELAKHGSTNLEFDFDAQLRRRFDGVE